MIQTEKGCNPEFCQQSCLITRCGCHLKSTCTLTLKRFPTLDNAQNYYQPTPDLTLLLLLLKCLLFTEYWLRFAPSEHLNHARCDDCPPLFTSLKTRNCSIFTAERWGDDCRQTQKDRHWTDRGGARGLGCTALLE